MFIGKAYTLWVVQPSEGGIPPEESIELRLTVYLDDCIRLVKSLSKSFRTSHSELRDSMTGVQVKGNVPITLIS